MSMWHKLKREDGRVVLGERKYTKPEDSGVFYKSDSIEQGVTKESICVNGVVTPYMAYHGQSRRQVWDRAVAAFEALKARKNPERDPRCTCPKNMREHMVSELRAECPVHPKCRCSSVGLSDYFCPAHPEVNVHSCRTPNVKNNPAITVNYLAVDGSRKTRTFSSLDAAQQFAQRWVGEMPELGSNYAISADGVGRIMVQGALIRDLFPKLGSDSWDNPRARRNLSSGEPPRQKLIVLNDYDGYFEALVRGWMGHVTNPKHHTVQVSAGPYRPDALTYSSKNGVITLDFYSALRTGFGQLSAQDIAEIIELL